MKNAHIYYLYALVVGALVIALEHLLVPVATRAAMVAGFAGPDYASRQLAAFAARPVLIGAHAVAGVLFALAVPFQLQGPARGRRQVHRILGWVFVVSAWAMALSGIGVAYVYPFAGRAGIIPNIVSALALVGFTVTAVRCARSRQFERHQAWMLRTAAIGLGIVLSRLYVPLLVQVAGLPASQAMAQVFWLGSGTNLLVVELLMRNAARPAAGRLQSAA